MAAPLALVASSASSLASSATLPKLFPFRVSSYSLAHAGHRCSLLRGLPQSVRAPLLPLVHLPLAAPTLLFRLMLAASSARLVTLSTNLPVPFLFKVRSHLYSYSANSLLITLHLTERQAGNGGSAGAAGGLVDELKGLVGDLTKLLPL